MSYLRPRVRAHKRKGFLGALGDALFAASLPSCSSVPAGTPCKSSDGTPLFLPDCSSVPAGTPCNDTVNATPGHAFDFESVTSSPLLPYVAVGGLAYFLFLRK